MSKPRAALINARVPSHNNTILVGEAMNHPRYPDYYPISTSNVVAINDNLETVEVETRNTSYVLIKPYNLDGLEVLDEED